jgi:hypothetical protein
VIEKKMAEVVARDDKFVREYEPRDRRWPSLNATAIS